MLDFQVPGIFRKYMYWAETPYTGRTSKAQHAELNWNTYIQMKPSMNLYDDLKWKIFMLNAIDTTVEMRHRLKTTIATSQVCRDWRQIILSSSSIWGQLILIAGHQASGCLREVLLRSGDSLLCVDANFTLPDDMDEGNLAIFFKIIENNWERVESLRVVMDRKKAGEYICKRMLTAFDKPAPLLREFAVKNPRLWGPEEITIGNPWKVFKDQAPKLRIFDCIPITPSSSSSWLRNLSVLHFTPASISQVLTVLSSNSTVEVLKISSYTYTPQSDDALLSDRQPVSIPSSLKSFSLVTTLGMFLNIWPLIVRPLESTTLCTISQTICFVGTDMPLRQHKQQLIKELNRIAHFHDDLNPPPDLRKLTIDVVLRTVTLKRGPYSEFAMLMLTNPMLMFQSVFSFVADEFPSIYENVTNLEIGYTLMRYRSSNGIKSFLLKMHSVTDLTFGTIDNNRLLSLFYSNCASATSVLDTDMFVPLIFPNLRTIRVQRWTEESLIPLDEYLYRRSNVLKAPIKHLYIEVHSQDRPKEPQRFFSDIHGLEVTWDNGTMG